MYVRVCVCVCKREKDSSAIAECLNIFRMPCLCAIESCELAQTRRGSFYDIQVEWRCECKIPLMGASWRSFFAVSWCCFVDGRHANYSFFRIDCLTRIVSRLWPRWIPQITWRQNEWGCARRVKIVCQNWITHEIILPLLNSSDKDTSTREDQGRFERLKRMRRAVPLERSLTLEGPNMPVWQFLNCYNFIPPRDVLSWFLVVLKMNFSGKWIFRSYKGVGLFIYLSV